MAIISEQLKNDFCKDIMQYVEEHSSSYMDAVIVLSEQTGFAPEMGAKLIDKPIIEKIRIEGEESNLLPKINKLPI